jgi:hypothetical protein
MTDPRVQAGMAMLHAALRAKAGAITMPEVLDLVETVNRLLPEDKLYRSAVRAFANRILLMSKADEGNCTAAGKALHDFLIEDGRKAEVAA